MYDSPTALSPEARATIAKALAGVLTDGIDLHSQIKVAHWNIKGPHFVSLHPLFDALATELAAHNDAIAERIVTLGGLAVGTARHVAAHSRLQDYPQETTLDLEHVKLLAARIGVWLESARTARAAALAHHLQERYGLYPSGLVLGPALSAKAAIDQNRLRPQTHMTHHRNTRLYQKTHRLRHFRISPF
jgi:starvation-inducible DNA-binding protein